MLLFLYLFFDQIQTLYIIFNAFIAGVCVEMTVRPYVSHMVSVSCLPKTVKVRPAEIPLFMHGLQMEYIEDLYVRHI